MNKLLCILLVLGFQLMAAQEFMPVPADLKSSYHFDFEQNFFKDAETLDNAMAGLGEQLRLVVQRISETKDQEGLINTLSVYDDAERQYRKLDLYFFLKYAVDMRNEKAMVISDSIRGEMVTVRALVKDKIFNLPKSTMDAQPADHKFAFYLEQLRSEEPYTLSESRQLMSSVFGYLKDNSFYDRALQHMTFEKVAAPDGEIDLLNEMSRWQNHPDPAVRQEAEQKYFLGYATQREALGSGYINYIKGLDAFSKLKGFDNLLEEKSFYNQIPNTVIENFFAAVLKSRPDSKENGEETAVPPTIRFTIEEATAIIMKSLAFLGPDYQSELGALLDPENGRMDIVGGDNRIPIRGTASVYPIFPSIFYALNYEGYLIDLSLLGHEAGHAIQATLMYNHKVPMVYARGPAYFTESFGKFNELLIFDYLLDTEKDIPRKKIYGQQLRERLEVLYGSTEEAFIEYFLLKGIIEGQIKTPEDLDTTTYALGMKINPVLYGRDPFRKGFWMLLDTSFREPYHNMHDMIASALAIRYYDLSKTNRAGFVSEYLGMLQNGYRDSPENILKALQIDITDPHFIEGVLDLLQTNPGTWEAGSSKQ